MRATYLGHVARMTFVQKQLLVWGAGTEVLRIQL
jgi:hypothetical protein